MCLRVTQQPFLAELPVAVQRQVLPPKRDVGAEEGDQQQARHV